MLYDTKQMCNGYVYVGLEVTDDDLLICGRCKALYCLKDVVDFIEHKVFCT